MKKLHREWMLLVGVCAGLLPFWILYITWHDLLIVSSPYVMVSVWRVCGIAFCPFMSLTFGLLGLRRTQRKRAHCLFRYLLAANLLVGVLGIVLIGFLLARTEYVPARSPGSLQFERTRTIFSRPFRKQPGNQRNSDNVKREPER